MLCAVALVVGYGMWNVVRYDVEPELRFETPITLVSAQGKSYHFWVNEAVTPQARQQGLMFVKSLSFNHGMLFTLPRKQPVSMWMKNTYIPLDMLFMNEAGVIEFIAKNATPHSTQRIVSPVAVQMILELPGGSSDRLDIKIGDRMVRSANGS